MFGLQNESYWSKSEAELRYIIRDAGAAARAVQNHDPKAEGKYLDQVNDACSVLHWRYQKAARNERGQGKLRARQSDLQMVGDHKRLDGLRRHQEGSRQGRPRVREAPQGKRGPARQFQLCRQPPPLLRNRCPTSSATRPTQASLARPGSRSNTSVMPSASPRPWPWAPTARTSCAGWSRTSTGRRW